MAKKHKDAPYNKLRFDWKEAVHADNRLSTGAQLLATYLCDKYVSKIDGCCWPSNETLARGRNLSVRAIQRQIKELRSRGYLEIAKRPRVRRTFRICFPPVVEDDVEHDIPPNEKLPNLSPKHDNPVAPNKNQGNNQEKVTRLVRPMSSVIIAAEDTQLLQCWHDWVNDHTDHDADQVFKWLRKIGGYHLPSRYIADADYQRYLAFFKLVAKSKGQCLPR